jgi:Putative transposase
MPASCNSFPPSNRCEPGAFLRYLAPLRGAEWVVYSKAPFDGPEQVLRYVSRHTHRVAISNDRLLDFEDGRVSFSWKDHRDNQRKTMTLVADEYIRRFLMHVLPKGFQRIRHYGFLANCCRGRKLALCRQLLRMPPHEPGSYLKNYRQRYEELAATPPSR